MISINTSIEALTRRGMLSAVFGAYLYAALLVAGPWIFTVIGLFCLSAATCDGVCIDLAIFRSIVIYNSMYALIVTSPLAFLSGRYVSEQIHSRRSESIFYALVLSLSFFALLNLGVAVPFYLWATALDATEKIASIQNAVLIGGSWLLIPFLGAVRSYNAVLVAFGVGAFSMLVFGREVHDPQVGSLLFAFNSSFAVTDLILLTAVVRRFGTKITVDPRLKESLCKNWELAAAGAAYALGLWIDKQIMWYFAPSGGLLVANALKTMPSYDTAMFWSQLSSIPIIAVFFVHVESRFSDLVRMFTVRLQQRASLRELNEIMGDIRTHVISSMFVLFVVLSVMAGMMIMLSFAFMAELGLRPAYMSILRVSLFSMPFFTSAMFCFTFLLYLDLRRAALQTVCTYVVLNAALTLSLLPLGPDLYGYGNMIASTISLLVGFGLLMRELSWLHYHAFITNNTSI